MMTLRSARIRIGGAPEQGDNMEDMDKLFTALRYMRALIDNGKSAEYAAGIAARAFNFKKDDLIRLYKMKGE